MQYRRLFCCCCCCSSSSSSSTSHRHRGGRLESRGSRTPLTYEEEEQNDAAGGGGAERVGGDGESGSGDVCGWLWFLVTLEWLDAGDRPNARRGGDDDRGTEDFFRREASMREGGAGVRRGDAGAVGGSRGSGRTMSADDAKPLLGDSQPFDLGEKERRFVKGPFVMPGSDVQRKIAEAMASMLAVGGKAMSSASLGSPRGDNASGGGGSGGIGSGNGGGGYSSSDVYLPLGKGQDGGSGGGGPTLSRMDSAGSERSVGSGTAYSRRSPSRRGVRREEDSEAFYVREAGGSVGSGDGGVGVPEQERECVICMEEFTKEDPEMLTLCSCGVNKTFFHYSCLLQWLGKQSYCPACRGYLYFEERHNARGSSASEGREESRHGSRRRSLPDVTSEEYRRAFHRALRAGLGSDEDVAKDSRDESRSEDRKDVG